jgi:hypothetical protein
MRAVPPRRPPRRSTKAAERKRRYRKRLRDGEIVVLVKVKHRVVDWLVRLNWLAQRECHERAEIGTAIEAMIDDAARG